MVRRRAFGPEVGHRCFGLRRHALSILESKSVLLVPSPDFNQLRLHFVARLSGARTRLLDAARQGHPGTFQFRFNSIEMYRLWL